MPTTEFYCPVCGHDITSIWVWQQPGSHRIRVFCEACSNRDEYRVLPRTEHTAMDWRTFQHFTATRLLKEVLEKEREKARG